MKKAIQFGAGNIGRGFIGYLLADSGYHVVFADVDQNIIDSINENKKYLVETVGEKVEKNYVENISAISSLDENIIKEIEEASLITTAVGPNILDKIAPTIAQGIKERSKKQNRNYLNIIACENMVGASEHLKEMVKKYLSEEEIEYLKNYVGFVNCAVDRIIPPMEENKENDIHVMVEEFKEWIVDKTQFKGEIPKIKGMELTENLMAYVERKIFTLNTGHAITAYLGYLKGYKTVRESIMDASIQEIVQGAMEESGKVLIKKYGFNIEKHYQYIQKILSRFKNPYLRDEVVRVARQPLRKLSKNDRLIKPLMGTIEFNINNKNLIKGIAAGLNYDYSKDEDAVKMQKILEENTLEIAIEKITGLDKDSKEVKLIKEEYLKIKS
ncbi:MAG: mannitol-phosphate 5-dehydrogenase [Candidatus Petromonas sp.]|nr:mannitol-phosphate 5-dehydrogenase [Candidatus Petromonas sp.]